MFAECTDEAEYDGGAGGGGVTRQQVRVTGGGGPAPVAAGRLAALQTSLQFTPLHWQTGGLINEIVLLTICIGN